MAVATHLADKSALARFHHVAVARRLGPMIEAGLVGTCGIIELEVRETVCEMGTSDCYRRRQRTASPAGWPEIAAMRS